MGSNKDDEPSVSEVALQSPIVLNQIFMHLPSNFLISTCSLVNKTWYRISRTVLRNHGKCLARISGRHACQQIGELVQLCVQMEKDGRVVPFNGLKIYHCDAYPFNPGWDPLDPENFVVYNEITSFMKLLHLEVETVDIGLPCPIQYKILSWILSGRCSHLQSLNIGSPLFLSELFYFWPTPQFPQLETMTIPNLPFNCVGDFIQRMLRTAPNLKRIIVEDAEMLNYLPSDKYKLLVEIPFHVKIAEQEQMLLKIRGAKPKLTELLIFPPSAAISEYDDYEDEELVDPAVKQRSDNVLELMLQTCHATLESIHVSGLLNPLGRLSFPPLINLRKITTTKWSSAGSERFWSDIASIDFNGSMPRLEIIKIIDTDRQCRPDGSLDFEKQMREWPTNGSGPLVPPGCSSNAHKLTLDLYDKKLNLIPIQSMAPDLTSLELKMRFSSGLQVDIAPFADIWKFWPQLAVLKINIGAEYPNRNYDADFCGICEEEAEVLREKDEIYLRNVHIVPVRPSILTMSKLRKLAFEPDFWGWNGSTDGSPTFLSHVTHILTFRKMQHTVIELAGIPMLP